VEVETLAAEIQSGVQHCRGLPSSRRGRAEHDSAGGPPSWHSFLEVRRGRESPTRPGRMSSRAHATRQELPAERRRARLLRRRRAAELAAGADPVRAGRAGPEPRVRDEDGVRSHLATSFERAAFGASGTVGSVRRLATFENGRSPPELNRDRLLDHPAQGAPTERLRGPRHPRPHPEPVRARLQRGRRALRLALHPRRPGRAHGTLRPTRAVLATRRMNATVVAAATT
jgi:hypothetical protein